MAEMSIERLTEFAEAWNKSDPDLVASYFTDDGSFFSSAGPDPLGRGYHGKVGIRQAARDFDARYPEAQFQNLKVFVAGDVGILEWELVVPDGAGGERPGRSDATCSSCAATSSIARVPSRSGGPSPNDRTSRDAVRARPQPGRRPEDLAMDRR